MVDAVVLVVMLFCSVRAIRATHLMNGAIWLAGVSALLAVLLYNLGAQVAAAIELSVGAGLVIVLFVFAISLAGDEPPSGRPVVSKGLALALIAAFAALLAYITMPTSAAGSRAADGTFMETFWHARSADALAQIVLIFAGALTVLGLLAERRDRAKSLFIPKQEAAIREEERL